MTMSERVQQLRRLRTPFVHATVVRAQQPTSAHPGDQAILLSDGTIEGFVGGQCAQNSVRKAALGALQAGDSVLLRVLPDGEIHFPEAPGACVVVNPCLSGGALEIFLAPQVPGIAAGFAIIWALAWRRQHAAVAAIEERDGVSFYVRRTSPFQPIALHRTPGFRALRPEPTNGSVT